MTRESYQSAGVVKGGKFAGMQDRTSFERAMAEFEDGLLIVTFDSATAAEIRTLQANKYQWKLFTVMGEEMGGVSKEDVHDLMCARFLTEYVETIDKHTGEVTQTAVVRGTSRLPKKRHTKFIEDVKLFAQEFLGMDLEHLEAA